VVPIRVESRLKSVTSWLMIAVPRPLSVDCHGWRSSRNLALRPPVSAVRLPAVETLAQDGVTRRSHNRGEIYDLINGQTILDGRLGSPSLEV
jgi:hypothetical protein